MPETDEQLTVTRDDEQSRYEIFVGETLGGFATFRTDSRGRAVFDDTQIDPAFKGRGLGKKLVGDAMTDAAGRGDTVVPACPFVVHYLQDNDVPGLVIDWPEHVGD